LRADRADLVGPADGIAGQRRAGVRGGRGGTPGAAADGGAGMIARQPVSAAALMIAGMLLPSGWTIPSLALAGIAAAVSAVHGLFPPAGPSRVTRKQRRAGFQDALAGIGLVVGAVAPLLLLESGPRPGTQLPGLWLFLGGLLVLLWSLLGRLARSGQSGAAALVAPRLFGVAVLYLWQVLVVGFAVPQVLLPAPSQVGHVLATRLDVLWPDFEQTFLKSVLSGFAMGCGAGFVVAVLIDRVPFLQRGLLPLSGLVSAMPIVGIAPI